MCVKIQGCPKRMRLNDDLKLFNEDPMIENSLQINIYIIYI